MSPRSAGQAPQEDPIIEAARSRDLPWGALAARSCELLVSLGDYTGNEDKRTGIDRCEVLLNLRNFWNSYAQGGSAEEWNALRAALKPLADIADEYDADELDEARPYWVLSGAQKFDLGAALYMGRGGKSLLTLGDAMEARRALTGKPYTQPSAGKELLRAKEIYEATNDGGSGWSVLGEERRKQLIENYRKAGLL